MTNQQLQGKYLQKNNNKHNEQKMYKTKSNGRFYMNGRRDTG
jgi:hypothetical protein